MSASAGAYVHQTFERATKETFVETMLHRVADGLSSDSPFGYNSANQIRGRVEEIADKTNEASAGRKVLEARFAMGADDSQYLSQAVSLLWAGDGGERLRVVPAPMMPEIMRHASAEGIVLAMQRVMKDKKDGNLKRVQRGLNLAAWLLQVPEIRTAVVEFMGASWQEDVVKTCGKQIENEYLKTTRDGVDYAGSLLGSDTESEDYANRLAVAEALLMALHAIASDQGLPMRMVAHRQQHTTELVRQAAVDSAVVLGMAAKGLVGVRPEVQLAGEAALKDAAAGANTEVDAYCVQYDKNDEPITLPVLAKPQQEIFQSVVVAGYNRIAGMQSTPPIKGSNVAVRSEIQPLGDHTAPQEKGWKLDRVVSPLHKQGPIRGPGMRTKKSQTSPWAMLYDVNANAYGSYAEADVGREMYVGMGQAMATGSLPALLAPYQDDRVQPDTLFVDFCMVRGLCGFRGPHQQAAGAALGAEDQEGPPLHYHYPTSMMKDYSKGSLMRMQDAPISTEMHSVSQSLQARLYGGVEGLLDSLNPDFVGDVVPMAAESNVARPALWAPVPRASSENDELSLDDEVATEACAAATYEFMAASFTKHAARVKEAKQPEESVRLLRAAAAAAKILQLPAMTTVHSQVGSFLRYPSESPNVAYVTRPVLRCDDAKDRRADKVRLPVDVGLARFVRLENEDKTGPRNPNDAALFIPELPDDRAGKSNLPAWNGTAAVGVEVNDAVTTNWLQGGVQKGWGVGVSAWTERRPFGMYLGAAADASAVDTSASEGLVSSRDLQVARQMAAADLEHERLQNALAQALMAVRELEQVEHEGSYIQKLRTKGSAEQQGIFGIKAMVGNIEDASRDRRMAVWSDALREVAVSGDRLYRFVTQLTGAIGESADSAISWEDEDLKQMAKEAAARQKALAERVARFQTKLVESVVSSTLKASKLQLEVRGGSSRDGHDGELVVLSGEVKDNLRQVMSGEGGHGLFEANVELNDLLGTAARPMHIGHIVNKLQAVSQEYHDQVAQGITPNAPASYARVVEPRNSFMMHLKPDTSNAIQKAFDYITAEMRHCGGLHRHISLWEFVEGRDWTLVTRFAELVGLMLQNTRMRSGSFAAYVGNTQLITNTQNIRTQLQRLRSQVCMYLGTQPNTPLFLHKDGRTFYFGGSVKPTTKADDVRIEREKDKKARLGDASPFDAQPLDDGVDPTDKATRAATRRKLLERLQRMARARRNSGAPRSSGSTTAAAFMRWTEGASVRSPLGSVDHMTLLHLHGRNVLQKLLLGNDDKLATLDELRHRLRVLLQLRLTVQESVTAGTLATDKEEPPLQLVSADSHMLYLHLHKTLTTKGTPVHTVLDNDKSGERLSLPSSRNNLEIIQGEQHNYVELGNANAFVKSVAVPTVDEVGRKHVSLALNAVFGLPNDLEWNPHPNQTEHPNRWVCKADHTEHELFQMDTVAWHTKAVDFSETHNFPVAVVLMAWCAQLMIACTVDKAFSQALAAEAKRVCDVASYEGVGEPTENVPLAFGTHAQALELSFDMEENAVELTDERLQCLQDVRKSMEEGGEGRMVLDEYSDESFTPYKLAMHVTITRPHRVLMRLLEQVTGEAAKETRIKFIASLRSAPSQVLSDDDSGRSAAEQLLKTLQKTLGAPEVRDKKDFGPKTTFGDWLQLRLGAEQHALELLLLTSVQTTSLRSLGSGTPAYQEVLAQVGRYVAQSEQAHKVSLQFLKQHSNKLFGAWEVSTTELQQIVTNGSADMLVDLRAGMRTVRSSLAAAHGGV